MPFLQSQTCSPADGSKPREILMTGGNDDMNDDAEEDETDEKRQF